MTRDLLHMAATRREWEGRQFRAHESCDECRRLRVMLWAACCVASVLMVAAIVGWMR